MGRDAAMAARSAEPVHCLPHARSDRFSRIACSQNSCCRPPGRPGRRKPGGARISRASDRRPRRRPRNPRPCSAKPRPAPHPGRKGSWRARHHRPGRAPYSAAALTFLIAMLLLRGGNWNTAYSAVTARTGKSAKAGMKPALPRNPTAASRGVRLSPNSSLRSSERSHQNWSNAIRSVWESSVKTWPDAESQPSPTRSPLYLTLDVIRFPALSVYLMGENSVRRTLDMFRMCGASTTSHVPSPSSKLARAVSAEALACSLTKSSAWKSSALEEEARTLPARTKSRRPRRLALARIGLRLDSADALRVCPLARVTRARQTSIARARWTRDFREGTEKTCQFGDRR